MDEPQLIILASFFPDTNRIRTTKDIENISGYSHERAHTILTDLERKGFVVRRKLGKVNVYRLNLLRPVFLAYLFFVEKEREKRFDSNQALAEKLEKISSDAEDLCDSLVFVQSKDKMDFVCLLRDNDAESRRKVSDVVGKNVNFVKTSEFHGAGKELRDSVLNGLVISGTEIFYRTVYRRGSLNAEEI